MPKLPKKTGKSNSGKVKGLGVSIEAAKKKPIGFSFQHLDLDDKDFSHHGQQSEYFRCLIERLKNLSTWTRIELETNRSSAIRCHRIDWDKDSVSRNSFGLANEDQLAPEAYQFQISSNEHGRIHGFWIENIFYIRWLDPKHLLYPGK